MPLIESLDDIASFNIYNFFLSFPSHPRNHHQSIINILVENNKGKKGTKRNWGLAFSHSASWGHTHTLTKHVKCQFFSIITPDNQEDKNPPYLQYTTFCIIKSRFVSEDAQITHSWVDNITPEGVTAMVITCTAVCMVSNQMTVVIHLCRAHVRHLLVQFLYKTEKKILFQWALSSLTIYDTEKSFLTCTP